MRASSWASTTTRRARSVNRSNMGIAPWTSRVGRTHAPHVGPTLSPPYVFRRNSVFALSEQTACPVVPKPGAKLARRATARVRSVRRRVGVADLGGDPATIGDVEAVLA